MRVYYFTSEEFALSNIINQRVKISLLDDLNDPYEFIGVDLSDKRFRKSFKDARNAIASLAGVVCFSRSWRNPLMWGHYGNKHRGICLGFDVADEQLKNVKYIDKLLQPDIDMKKMFGSLNQEFVENLFLIKYEGWSYEDEVRVLVRLEEKDNSGFYFASFEGNMDLKEVILGARSTATVEQVKKYLCAYNSRVTVFKARPAFTKYEMVRDKLVERYVHSFG